MRIMLVSLMLALTPLIGGVEASIAQAQMAPVGNAPLVVIRFNQRQVYYERQLFTALEQAVAVKPSVLFEVVSYVPTGQDERAQADLFARAQAETNRVLGSFAEMGVPAERIQVSTERDGSLKHHEVHIFVY